jgi:hypothetical protein
MDGGDAFFQIMIMHDGWQMGRSKEDLVLRNKRRPPQRKLFKNK